MLVRILLIFLLPIIGFYAGMGRAQIMEGEEAPWIWQETSIYNPNWEEGYVGINTRYPQFPLDVSGEINSSAYLLNGTPVGIWEKTGNNLFFSSGFIGIGTGNPTSLLTLAGDLDQLKVLGAGADFQMSLWGIDDSHAGEFTFNLNAPPPGEANPGYYFNLNNQNRLFLDPQGVLALTGRMGIGKSNPEHPLELYDNEKPYLKIATGNPGEENVVFLGVEKNMSLSSLSNWGDALLVTETPGNLIISNKYGGIKFGAGIGSVEQELMTIDVNGIGIGTQPSIGSRLAVNGVIKSKEIIVTESGWSDFVFYDDYRLRTLDEVERHILKNKRLPDIPGSQEVAERGVNLGEMQGLLLQKIEELTLYVIEQNKRIRQLESQLQQE